MMKRYFRNLLLVLIAVFVVISACSDPEPHQTNFTQADLMLHIMKSASEGQIDSACIDEMLITQGMNLIIEQQNVRGRIEKSQYDTLLSGLNSDQSPMIQPIDSSQKAKLGAKRLNEQIWIILKWGMTHIDSLEFRLNHLKKLKIGRQAELLAESFLPVPINSIPGIYFVMGGRAGFYAGEKNIFMDVLNMSFSCDNRKENFISDKEIMNYFAHEMHHIGYSNLRKRQYDNLILDDNETRALGFISGLLSEGSATYLISWNKDIDVMKNRYRKFFDMGDGLLDICSQILESIFQGKIKNVDDYSLATRPLLGMGYHAAGSRMIHIIYQAGGLKPIMKIMEDPRTFVVEYNNAAKNVMQNPESDKQYLFDSDLAIRVSKIGK
jgi:hypothetical protein